MSPDTADPARILVRGPTWLGDVVMATPALRALRQTYPRAEIVFEAAPVMGELLAGVASIDRFLPDDGASVLARARGLRAQEFDWAVLMPDSIRAAAAPWLARVPFRVGYARDPLRRAMLTQRLTHPGEGGERRAYSMIERYLRITRALGCADAGDTLDLVVDDGARSQVRERLVRAGLSTSDYFVVTPGANFGVSKLWPAEHFASACDRLSRERGLRAVLAPGPGEEATAQSIVDRMSEPAVVLVDVGLAGLTALIDAGRMLLTNDTGPRHIAVARDTPVVVLMGPTNPAHTAHLLERQRVLREDVDCSPCQLKVCPIDHRCMTRLSPERAVKAANELLG